MRKAAASVAQGRRIRDCWDILYTYYCMHITLKLRGLKQFQPFIISWSFYGLGTWEQLNWVVLARCLLKSPSQMSLGAPVT